MAQGCSFKGCIQPHAARGLCDTHYRRWKRNGMTEIRRHFWPKTCTECGLPSKQRGLCSKHYGTWHRRQDPTIQIRTDDLGRFSAKMVLVGDCWLWTGAVIYSGYGRAVLSGDRLGKSSLAHRSVYELLVGPIPEGLTLDHRCRQRDCVNPAHLEPVTVRENIQRGAAARRRRRQVARDS